MLKVRNVDVYYGNLRILDGISLDVSEGEMVALIGNNGAGKTTFLMSLCGIIRATSGTIEFLRTSLAKLPPARIFRLGMVQASQDGDLFLEMTVLENLYQGAYRSPRVTNIDDGLQEAFDYFPVLAQRKRQKAGTLSGGEQRMLAIARALMANPKFLLLDEPSSGLAPIIVENLAEIIKTLHEKGLTILLVEQNAYMALGLADTGYVLENGQIVMSGKATDLLQNKQVKEAYLGA
jgi:branched-chain amino acid transport system ATP-binding protein